MYEKMMKYQSFLRRTVAVSATVFAFSAFLYGAFLLTAVERTAARAATEETAQALAIKLAHLESRYLAANQALTLTRALDMGFSVPPQTTTLFADASAPALSLRHVSEP